jgi:hypothetical protein
MCLHPIAQPFGRDGLDIVSSMRLCLILVVTVLINVEKLNFNTMQGSACTLSADFTHLALRAHAWGVGLNIKSIYVGVGLW